MIYVDNWHELSVFSSANCGNYLKKKSENGLGVQVIKIWTVSTSICLDARRWLVLENCFLLACDAVCLCSGNFKCVSCQCITIYTAVVVSIGSSQVPGLTRGWGLWSDSVARRINKASAKPCPPLTLPWTHPFIVCKPAGRVEHVVDACINCNQPQWKWNSTESDEHSILMTETSGHCGLACVCRVGR